MSTTENMRNSVSIPELARMHPISEALLYRLAGESRLPGCRRLGHRYLVHLETFETWLKSGTGEDK